MSKPDKYVTAGIPGFLAKVGVLERKLPIGVCFQAHLVPSEVHCWIGNTEMNKHVVEAQVRDIVELWDEFAKKLKARLDSPRAGAG